MNDKETQYFQYLDQLRLTGKVNMIASSSYLQKEFFLTKKEASIVLGNWIKQFNKKQCKDCD